MTLLPETAAWNNKGMQSIRCMFWAIYAVYRLHICEKDAVYIIYRSIHSPRY